MWFATPAKRLASYMLVLVCIGQASCKSENLRSFVRFSLRIIGGERLVPPKKNPNVFIPKKPMDTTLHEMDDLQKATFIAETNLPTDLGFFRLRAYRIPRTSNQHVGTEPCVIYSADKPPFGRDGKLKENVPVRVHDQCLTSEVFGSQRCDCKEQLEMSLAYIRKHGGAIIYMQQEGRGIGLGNKVAAYALQDQGLDTVDANVYLGFPEDCRQYGAVPSILSDLRIHSIQLITNNPRKVQRLTALGVCVSGTIPMVVTEANPHNRRYLETKQERMQHSNFGAMLALSEPSFSSFPLWIWKVILFVIVSCLVGR